MLLIAKDNFYVHTIFDIYEAFVRDRNDYEVSIMVQLNPFNCNL